MAQQRSIRILITGGGSGGHLFPLLAIAEALRDRTRPSTGSGQARVTGMPLDLRYVGDPADYEFLLRGRGVRVSRVMASKWRRYFSIKNFLEPFRAAIGLIQALWKIFWFMPDAAFSKGGPGALVILSVCRWYRIPYVIHESDAAPGLTNLVSARGARVVELAFPQAEGYFKAMRGEKRVVGNPVRREILAPPAPRDRAKTELGFDPARALLLVLGGSQGAVFMNSFILEHLAMLLPRIQIFHQTGADNFDAYRKNYEERKKEISPALAKAYRIVPFFVDDLPAALSAADVVLSRAGAGAIFEFAARGLPSILVPITDSPRNHQRENAYAYERAAACVVIEEENLLPQLLLDTLERILGRAGESPQNPAASGTPKSRTATSGQVAGQADRMTAAARAFYRPNAAEAIAEDIVRVATSAH